MSTLRRAIHGLLDSRASERITKVISVFTEAAEDIRAAADTDDAIVAAIDNTTQALIQLGFDARPINEIALEQHISEIPEPDGSILREFRAGRSFNEIAALIGARKEDVLRSVARSYARLRVNMRMDGLM